VGSAVFAWALYVAEWFIVTTPPDTLSKGRHLCRRLLVSLNLHLDLSAANSTAAATGGVSLVGALGYMTLFAMQTIEIFGQYV
jgi:hypothetical protein